ncbi:hypothetical protein ABB37_00179 [Leptomonas pyrrhocoris]|uniref:Uncharacterized protein n=1 Tax=Leptomonas pyrrhocoris TaxID=157538 RepID=A0A0M9G9V6_LEPPY|nr:hypothetical protein ABB37_00179 [Leptomonas pyrrhocoris]KPA85850.1 hypothetical protein ABB37_00179 [Leptomonas pyrrhocoris]|eukprot:XP_015664289.1 hypothetical protein ABB37_00179 [Leptomonas pyrrhocoris]
MQRLTTAGPYVTADRTVKHHQLRCEAELSGTLESLAKDAASQWSSLQRAKAQSHLQEQSKAFSTEQQHFERLLEAQRVRCQRSEAALARFSAKEAEKLNAPSGARVTPQGSLTAATRSRSENVDRRVRREADCLLTQEAAALEKDQFGITVLQCELAAEQQRATTQVRLLESGMVAAQRRTQQQILKMRRTGDVSRATADVAHRGAALEARVYGDAYRVPSLCEYYGPLLEQPTSAPPAA